MKNTLTLLFSAIATCGTIYGQDVEVLNVSTYGSSESDLGIAVAVDGSDNLISVGGFRGTIDFDPGDGTTDLASNLGSEDIYITKCDSDGNLLWAHALGSYNHERAAGVTTDSDDNIYVTGRFFGTTDFDPGAGIAELIAPGGTSDVFVLKLDGDGNFIWAKNIGGTSTDQGLAIDVSPTGNVYLAGVFQGTADFDPGAGVYELTAIDGSPNTCYVLKLDAAGNFAWAKAFSGDSGNNIANDIVVDAADNCYVTGSFAGTGDIDPGPGVMMVTTAGYDDIFVSKFNPSGDLVWANTFGSAYGEWAEEITLDGAGNIVLTGYFRLTIDFDPGAGDASLTTLGAVDMFVLKLTAAGAYVWAKQAGGIGADATGLSISTDGDNNSYLGGKYSGTVDFNPSGTEALMTSAGSADNFVLKFNSAGDFEWVKSMGGAAEEFGGRGIALDSEANIYVTGSYSDGADFNPGGSPWIESAVGGFDIFTVKLGTCNLDLSVNQDGAALTAYQVGASYQWLNCGAAYAVIDGATDATYTAAMDGEYAVQITLGACVDTSDCLTVSGVGIEAFATQKDALFIHPNPSKSHITVQSNSTITEILIYDSYGKLVAVEKEAFFSISHLANGIYTLQVIGENQIKTKRFIKE